MTMSAVPGEPLENKVGTELRAAAAAFGLVWVLGNPVPAPGATAPLLALYTAFAVLLVVLARREKGARWLRAACWIDLAFFAALSTIGGPMQPFLLLLLALSIFIASLDAGFARARRVAGVAALVMTVLLVLHVLWIARGASSPSIATAAVALAAGLVFARWVELSRRRARELALENELLAMICIPRPIQDFGSRIAQALRGYCRADACFLLLESGEGGCLACAKAEPAPGGTEEAPDRKVRDELRRLLRSMPPARIYVHAAGGARGPGVDKVYEGPEMKAVPQADGFGERLARTLGADALLSLPVANNGSAAGRAVIAARMLHLSAADARFLMRLLGRAAMALPASRAAERSAAEAAKATRRKISRDLHDSTLQPYIGLKLGLEALQRKIAPEDPIAAEVNELTAMVTESIEDLREYVVDLKAARPKQEPASLLHAVNREAEKFRRHHGIAVTVNAQQDLSLGAAMAKEVRHLVREALSNIRRHTPSEHAVIGLRREDRRLVMEFINDDSTCSRAGSFFPKSLAERARDLGGSVDVDNRHMGRTAVKVEVPV